MKMAPEDFFNWIGPAARMICPMHGLYPSVCMAQAAIESSWGEDVIGKYNLFGRKAVDGDNYEVLPTKEWDEDLQDYVIIDAKFKLYESLEEAIADYCILLTEEDAYSGSLIFLGKDKESFIRSMADVYATEQKYADMIIDTINANDLEEWDT